MNNGFALKVGLRYLFVGSSGFSKLVNTISILGLALGIVLMIVVSSVHNGLADERRNMLLRVVPHAFLEADSATSGQVERIRELDKVTSMRQEFRGLAIVSGGMTTPVALDLIGVDLRSDSALVLNYTAGGLSASGVANGIVLPQNLASRNGIAIGDIVDLTFVIPTDTGLNPTTASYELAGLFQFVTEVDAQSAIVSLDSLVERGLLGTGTFGWNISVADPFQVDALFSDDPNIVTWIDTHGEAFRAYQLERVAMYLLMTLVLLLASFNIIAGQAMLINVKRADIAILTTMGASRKQLLGAFAIQGGVVAALGIVIGLIVGLAIATNIDVLFDMIDDLFGITILEQTAFVALPSRVAAGDVVLAVLIATLLGAFALWKPLRLALLESPAFVLNRAA